MSSINRFKLTTFAIIFTFCTIFIPAVLQAQETTYRLDNGMEVILKENHSSPMVASMVFVKSGSKYESQYENGITHFLEHLLFDGTANQTREELDASIRDLGGYINAFTRKEMTAYLVLLPKQYIDFGMTVQVDMLYNSLIPESELPKERKVVIEEINRDKDSPGYAAEKFYTEKAYDNTLYNRPVLGYKAFIENIPRETIVDYWKRFYTPENMTLLVIGDFDSESMKEQVQTIFGQVAPVGNDSIENSRLMEEPVEPDIVLKDMLTSQVVFDTVANVKSTHINFSFKAPPLNDSDYYAVDLVSQYLSLDDISPMIKALKGGVDPLCSEASIYLSTYEEFTRLEVSALTEDDTKSAEIVSTIIDYISNVSGHNADTEALNGIKTSVKTDDIYNSEKLHYLGFLVGPMMVTAGWDFVSDYAENLEQVTWTDCQAAASRWFDDAKFVATIVHPAKENDVVYEPYELSTEEVTAHFATAKYPDYVVDSGSVALTFPSTDSVSFELEDRSEYYREELANGLTVIIKRNPDSRVFGMNIIGKNRTASETAMNNGITDFVNRCLEKGTVTRNASELNRDLNKIGANVTLFDNPWIPYDDRYTSRRFSFMKFETIDEYAEKGFHLFTEMILYPAFDEDEVENVRRSMMGVLGRNSASPSKVAKDQFYSTMFAENVFDKPIMGSQMSIGSITPEALLEYHKKYYAPDNIILSVTSNLEIEKIMGWVNDRFGRLSPLDEKIESAVVNRPVVLEMKSAHTDLEKEQINIYIGSPLPGASDKDAASIKVAASILSERLYLNLREKQGLAYSVGAGATFANECGWYYSSIGTGYENYQKAVDGIILQIEKLKYDGPTEDEVNRAKNKIWGRLMSTKLSAINQAYYLGLNEFLGLGVDYDKQFLKQLETVNIEEIRRVTSLYFKTDNYVISTAGKKE